MASHNTAIAHAVDRERVSPRQVGLTRDHLLSAALDVMNEIGYERTTVGMIAARAHISRATIYRYFANKTDILDQLIETHNANLFASCLKLAKVTPGDREALAQWLDGFHGLYFDPRGDLGNQAMSRASELQRAARINRATRQVIKTWERAGWVATTPLAPNHLQLLFGMMSNWCFYRFTLGVRETRVSREALLDIVSRELALVFRQSVGG